MEISDLIQIGKLQYHKAKNEFALKLDKEYLHLSERLTEIFLIFKDHRVRYAKIDILSLGRIRIHDEDLIEEIGSEDYVQICLDDQALSLIDDEYEYFDPVGMNVICNDEIVGSIIDYFFNGAHDVYEIKLHDDSVILIPDVESFVMETNVPSRFIKAKDLDQFMF